MSSRERELTLSEKLGGLKERRRRKRGTVAVSGRGSAVCINKMIQTRIRSRHHVGERSVSGGFFVRGWMKIWMQAWIRGFKGGCSNWRKQPRSGRVRVREKICTENLLKVTKREEGEVRPGWGRLGEIGKVESRVGRERRKRRGCRINWFSCVREGDSQRGLKKEPSYV